LQKTAYIEDDSMHYIIIAELLGALQMSAPQRKFMQFLLTGWLWVGGRFNFTNLGRYLGIHERTIRRGFARGFAWEEFNRLLLEKLIAGGSELIAALDATFISKSGHKTEGLDYYFNGCRGRSEKGLEASALCVVDVTENTAYALSVRQTLPQGVPPAEKCPKRGKKVPGQGCRQKTEETRIDGYIEHLKEVVPFLPKAVRHIAVDGYYAKKKFVDATCSLNLEVIGKLRRDAGLKYLYRGPQKQRGRRRLYDSKVVWGRLDRRRWKCEGMVDKRVKVSTAVLYHVSLKRIVRVVLLERIDGGHQPILLFSTDLKLRGKDIVRYYRARFQIEFLFRDAKQGTGLNDCQARNAKALQFHWNAALCTLNIAKWQAACRGKTPSFSLASCKQRNSNEHLLELFSAMLGLDLNLIKSQPNYEHLLNYGVIQQ
jgi:hypothetical protein